MTSRTMRTGAVARTPPLGLTSHRADRGPVRRIFGHPATHCITDDSDTGPWSGRAEPTARPSCRSNLLGQTDNMTLRVGDQRE